jgi:hypothetical protein
MCAIKFAVDRNHFWLKPEPKVESLFLDLRREVSQPARQLPSMDEPITQGRAVVVAVAKPTVIKNKELDAQARRGSSDLV